MLRAAEGAVDEADLGGHERATRLTGQWGGRRIVNEERPEFLPGRARRQTREILKGELSAAEDLKGRRLSTTDDLVRHRLCVAKELDGRRCSVLHTFSVCRVEMKHGAKLLKNPHITKDFWE